MSDKPRYLFDTNVIVSGVLFEHSTPGQAFYRARRRGRILLSEDAVRELRDVLARDKFDRYLLREEREEFLAVLVHEALLVDVDEEVDVCRDPKDNMLLELALCGSATCIVTGDEDLLTLNPFRGIPIITASEFLASLPDEIT